MSCDELRDQYELYALGVLDAAERAELDHHLHREGDPCIERVQHARQLVSSLALIAPESRPPARLRSRVVGLVSEPKRSWFGVPAWIAVAGRADAIVTHNIRHFPRIEKFGIQLMTPAKFLRTMKGEGI
jgi:anti-sigma factor RsiW